MGHRFVSTLVLTHELETKETAGLGLDIRSPGRVAGPTWEVKEGRLCSHRLSPHVLSTDKETALHLWGFQGARWKLPWQQALPAPGPLRGAV